MLVLITNNAISCIDDIDKRRILQFILVFNNEQQAAVSLLLVEVIIDHVIMSNSPKVVRVPLLQVVKRVNQEGYSSTPVQQLLMQCF